MISQSKERTFQFHESRGVASKNPHVRVWRLLSQERCHQSGYASDFYFHDVAYVSCLVLPLVTAFSPSGRFSSFITRGLGVVATMDTVVCGTLAGCA